MFMFYPFFCSFVSSVILFGELILFTIQADLLLVSPGSSLLVERCHKKSEERVSAPPVAAKVGQKRQRDENQGEDDPLMPIFGAGGSNQDVRSQPEASGARRSRRFKSGMWHGRR